MTAPEPAKFQIPSGVIAVTSHGHVQLETVRCLLDVRAACEQQGLRNIAWAFVPGNLVEKTRNEAAQMFLNTPQAAWLLFIDADMVFDMNTFMGVLQTAFLDCPWADIVGAWCPLRGDPYLPTIDTGSGTWEPQEPGQGPLEVIRTGAAFVLTKRHVYERMEFPWYGTRPVPRSLDVMAELDNFARIKCDGRNPFAETEAWERLLAAARVESPPATRAGFVGEDSNFTDRAKALGFRIVVQTNAVCGHIDKRIIGPADHRAAIQKRQALARMASGILT